jgi:acetyl esterase
VPLNPEAQLLVDAIQAGPPTETMTPAEARAASTARRAGQVRQVEQLADVTDHEIDGPGGPLTLRVYRPTTEPDLPVVVFAHGGGWVICDLDSHDPLCRTLAAEVGAVVVAVDYRRAPEDPYPAALDDLEAALRWVVAGATGLGVDVTRLAVAGDSAGGNLAAAVALRARDSGGPAIAAQLLVYPVLDSSLASDSYREFADGFGLTRAGMSWYWEQYVADPARRTEPGAAPSYADSLAGLPPAIVAVAECDPLRDEGVAYAERIAREGGQAWSRVYPSGFHGFLSLPPGILPVADEALAEVTARLRDLLHGAR